MKTIQTTTKILLLAIVMVASQHLSAQEKTSTEKSEFRIKVERDIDGKKENIDRTFSSRDEMTAFIKDNNIDMPAMPDEPGAAKIKVCENKGDKASSSKKITITEQTSADGKTNLEISTSDLSPEERASIIQAMMNIKGSKVEIKQERTVTTTTKVEN